MKKIILGGALAALLAGVSWVAWAATNFDAFITSRTSATQPLGSGDKFPLIQGGITTFLQANQVATLSDTQTLTNKTLNSANNSITINLSSAVTGILGTANGGTNLSAGTSGGVLCATSSSVYAWSSLLTANLPLIGGGAGVCPAVGSVSGNTTKFVTNTGTTPSGQGGSWDASGNWIANANALFANVAATITSQWTFGTVIASQNNQAGTTYTLASTDCGKTVYFTNAAAITATTLNSLPVGCTIALEQGGAGQITVTNGAGSTFNSTHGFTKTFGQYAVIGLYVDTNSGGSSAHLIFTGDGA